MWYHLNGGRYFFETGSVARTSFFSFIAPQRLWVNYYWLFQVLVYQLFSWFGYMGLIFFRTLLSCATLLMLFFYLYKDQKDRDVLLYYTLLFVFYVLLFLPRSLPVRPHLFSYLLIVIFLYVLEFSVSDTNLYSTGRPSLRPGTTGRQRGAPPTRGYPGVPRGTSRRVTSTPASGYPEGIRLKTNWYRGRWLLPPLAALWSNLHGVEYPVMLLVLGAYFVEFVWEQIKETDTPRDKTYVYPGILVFSAAAVLCTPHGIRLLAVPFKSIAQVSPFIYELKPLSIYDFISFFGILFLLAGFVAIAALKKKRMRVSHLILFLGGLALLPEAKRFVNEYALLVLPLLRAYIPIIPAAPRAKALKLVAIVLSVVFMAMPFFFMHSFFSHPPRYPVSARELPEGVSLFLKRVNATGSILNYPNTGGYLEWELYPGCKIFMDMQVPFLFTAEDFETARGAYTDQRVLREVITRYRPVFITTPIEMAGFRALIADHPQYRLIFFDDAEVLYVDGSQEPALAEQYEIKSHRPFFPL